MVLLCAEFWGKLLSGIKSVLAFSGYVTGFYSGKSLCTIVHIHLLLILIAPLPPRQCPLSLQPIPLRH